MKKDNYTKFAKIYSSGSYPEYSRYVAGKLLDILGKLEIRPDGILDLACGEGTFVREAEDLGFDAWGIDKSEEMIRIAKDKATRDGESPTFLRADMRDFSLEKKFDLVTSWFDSMNYLLKRAGLRRTFESVYDHLNRNGYFVFDVNTIYGLSVQWQEESCYVQRDDGEVYEVHRTSYEEAEKIATLDITFFLREGEGLWNRYEESHRERGYELNEISRTGEEAGLELKAIWDDLEDFSPPEENSGRVWFVFQKSEG